MIRLRDHYRDCPCCQNERHLIGRCLECEGAGQVECSSDTCDCRLACDVCGSFSLTVDMRSGSLIIQCLDCRKTELADEELDRVLRERLFGQRPITKRQAETAK